MATEKVTEIVNMADSLTPNEISELFHELDKKFRKSTIITPKTGTLTAVSQRN